MKHVRMYLTLVVLLSWTAYGQEGRLRAADLQEHGVYREGAMAIAPELDRGTFADVLASGVTPVYDEAVVGDGPVDDPAGNVAKSHVAFVPFVNMMTGKRGYYMRVSVTATDGTPMLEHEYTVHDVDCHCAEVDPQINTGSPPKLEVETQLLSLSDVTKLVKWIKARQWASVKSWITGQLTKGVSKALIANTVKAAFEKAGYWCPNLPWYVPGKFYIYLATCAKRAY